VTEYSWSLMVVGQVESVYWDSESLLLLAPPTVSFILNDMIENKRVVYVTPVGPRVLASLDDELAAWATIAEAIELSGYEVIIGSPCPIAPEAELLGNPSSD